ncbi:MAG: hypothetical protein L6R37_004314 [Teloschistes peruensis]|nr:MAG: hypothetical protein L6R37_004314 [Teloschistes peruensis]
MTTDDTNMTGEVGDVQQYRYKRLWTSTSIDEIRLLRIRAINADGRIDAQLIEMGIEDAKAQNYYALSYAWGQPLLTHHLYIDGSCLQITAHLHAALLSLKTLTKDRPGTWFWIDAICINQFDLNEKAGQIPLMRSIFSHAAKVIIWLCGDDDSISGVFKMIPTTLNDMKGVWSDKKLTIMQREQKMKEVLGSTNLNQLFEQDWFGRLWVVQEVAAADKALFACGSCTIDYNALDDMAAYVERASVASLSTRATSYWYCFKQTCKIRINERPKLEDGCSRLIHFLESTRYHECSDARDRLFALGGMIPGSNALPYAADYDKQTSTVYTDFAVHCAKNSQAMRILACSGLVQSRINHMASWVPDWEAKPMGALINAYRISPYLACGHKDTIPQECQIEGTGRYPVLIISGAIVDRIEATWPTASGHVADVTERDLRSGYFLEQCLLRLASYPIHSITWPTIWRTLALDTSVAGKNVVCATGAHEKAVASAIDGLVEKWQRFQRGPSGASETDTAKPQSGKSRGDSRRSRPSHGAWDWAVKSAKSGAGKGVQTPFWRRLPEWVKSPTDSTTLFLDTLYSLIDQRWQICMTDSGKLGK